MPEQITQGNTTGQQQGDLYAYQTPDGADITITNGVAEMDGGLRTSAYMALFGGSEYDDGISENPYQYWGNFIEDDPNEHLRSRTQYLLRTLPAVSANLVKIEQAAEQDLQYLIDIGAASSVEAVATITGPKKLKLRVVILAEGLETEFEFMANWEASAL